MFIFFFVNKKNCKDNLSNLLEVKQSFRGVPLIPGGNKRSYISKETFWLKICSLMFYLFLPPGKQKSKSEYFVKKDKSWKYTYEGRDSYNIVVGVLWVFTCPKLTTGNPRTRCEIFSKLTIKTPTRRHWHRSGVLTVNFSNISYFVLVVLLVTLQR